MENEIHIRIKTAFGNHSFVSKKFYRTPIIPKKPLADFTKPQTLFPFLTTEKVKPSRRTQMPDETRLGI